MSNSLRYGVLGAGMMGQEHIRNLALLEDINITMVAEPDAVMQERTRKLLPDATIVEGIDALAETKDLDALVIATPNYQHAEQLLTLLGRTNAAILVEKPLVTRIEDVARIRAAAQAHQAPVWVGMEYRFMPPLAAYREQLNAGAVGRLRMLSIREHRYPFLRKVNDWNRFNRNSGGTLVEKCCHFFDLMRLLVDDEAIRVQASAAQDVNHLDEQYDGETSDIWDNGFVIVDFASGARALLDLCMFAEGSRYEQEICATGERGKLECFIPGPKALWGDDLATPRLIESPRRPVGTREVEIVVEEALLAAGSHQGSTYYEHLGFRAAVRGEGDVAVTVEDGLKAVVLGMAAQVSAAEGRAVNIVEDGWSYR